MTAEGRTGITEAVPGTVAWVDDPGYWAVASHPVVASISADPDRFCSGRGILLDEIGASYDAPPTMMHTDPPAHTVYRALVQPAFGRRRMALLEPSIRDRVRPIVAALSDGETHDVVDELAVPVPIHVIIELLGCAEVADVERVRTWSDAAIPDAVEMTDDERMAAMGDMIATLLGVAARRRTDPADDVLSELATAALTGEDGTVNRLDDTELAMFGVQLVVAGNETTRNAIAGGLVALCEHPEQWEELTLPHANSDAGRGDLIALAVEEILRWTSPVVSFMRTATADVHLPLPGGGGVDVRSGDPLLLLYGRANRDPAEFGSSADRFLVRRSPNHHLAFGFGAHFCLGAALARLELRVVLEELLATGTSPALAGPVRRSPSRIIDGIESAPMRFT